MSARVLTLLLAALIVALPAPAQAKRKRLKAFSSCASLVSYGQRFADRENAPGGVAVSPVPPAPRTGGPEAQPVAAPQADAGSDFSGTNVQEAGIDEPDFVKTDGDVVYVASERVLYAIAARGTPRLLGRLRLGRGYDHQLLLHGDRLLVTHQGEGQAEPVAYAGQGREPAPSIAPAPDHWYEPKAKLTEVDVSDPAAMRVVRTLTTDGSVVAGRLTGATARIVISSMPEAIMARARAAGAKATASRRRARRWVPRAVVRDRRSGRRSRRALVSCRSVRRTPVYSGMGMTTVLTIDLGAGLNVVDSDAVMTDVQLVYASQSGLFLATQRWDDYDPRATEPPRTRTAIHAFDASQPGETRYLAGGEVPGYLLSQWALSERGGVLRVASTDMPPWWGGGDEPQSQSFVTTLGEHDGRLVKLGQLGGLGKGERIYAVRFIGDVGYVVTFRQVDPLYTVDVSDPAAPAVLGELKILGYSAYLHPAGDGLLIGVGQDATADGTTTGSQIVLFDVSDPAAPRRLHQRLIAEGSSSDVEWDHRAFLYWAPAKLAVLPVSIYEPFAGGDQPVSSDDAWTPPWQGAIGFGVDAAAGITETGRIAHPASEDDSWRGAIRRSLVVGDRLFSVSDLGVQASDLATLSGGAWVPFAAG